MFAGRVHLKSETVESVIDLLTEKLEDYGFEFEVVDDDDGLSISFSSKESKVVPKFLIIKVPVDIEEEEVDNDFDADVEADEVEH